LVRLGLILFTAQFTLQFFAIANGMPPGLASVAVQTQALWTILIAAAVLGERPTKGQLIGIGVALIGLALIAMTVGRGLTIIGLLLALASALSWGVGNVMLKRLPGMDMLHLVVWLSLIPPLPTLALSYWLDGPSALPTALAHASWLGIGAALYLGLMGTVVAYVIWGNLLRQYPAATIVPFALLVPCVGMFSTAIAFGEHFEPLRLAGVTAMLVGLAIIVLPKDKLLGFVHVIRLQRQ
ncbi:MAG: EamA family transporter, partial [Chloroflexi bacterium]|nr:EamA family transporter [Chloroflexota bacterium]